MIELKLGLQIVTEESDYNALAEDSVVDLDSYKSKKHHKPGYWVEGLSRADKAVLTNGKWFNNNTVYASQQLLSQQFPHLHGFQSVTLGRTLAFNIEFVQILHTGSTMIQCSNYKTGTMLTVCLHLSKHFRAPLNGFVTHVVGIAKFTALIVQTPACVG